MATIEERLLTAEEYGRLPDLGYPNELVRGKIVRMNVPYFQHGKYCSRIDRIVGRYVDEHDLGQLVTNDSGVVTERGPDTVRGPDVSFYSYSRLPRDTEVAGYPSVAPEIVFEVRSPDDRWPRILKKVGEYLSAGVLAVYVVDPQDETVRVYDSDQPGRTLAGDDELPFPQPLSGFRLSVRQLFWR